MTPERFQRIEKLLQDSLARTSQDRAAFLDQACADDAALRREVESLLAAHEQAGSFIEAPAVELAARNLGEAEMQSVMGKQIGPYRILSLLGAGGMGQVYLAEDGRLGRQVALKLLSAHFTNDPDRVTRFEREARAISSLNHPNIITIHEVGRAEETHFIVTEFVEGRTLRHVLAGERVPLRSVLRTSIQIAGALAAAHEAGIIHRDIKPENVMVRPDGLVKVLDFGLAKLSENVAPTDHKATLSMLSTAPGTVMGTLHYMSPEQARGLEMDTRTDIFSLGAMMYEMLTGHPAFDGETATDVILSVVDKEPKPLSEFNTEIPTEFLRIINKTLRKDRNERYQTARELLLDLKSLKQELEFDARIKGGQFSDEMDSAENQNDSVIQRPGNTFFAGRETLLLNSAAQPRSRFRLAVILTLIVLGAAAVGLYQYFNRRTALTEKDTVLLSEITNTTGEEVFDGALRQALAVHLEQTPFLNLFSDERIRETLRYMGKQPNERLTREVAREICQRQGIKAVLLGSIAKFDRSYSITLEAIDSQTGDNLASALVVADNKDQVIPSLSKAARELREKLGESLSTIQKFAAPIEQATTSSLDALKAWSRGVELARAAKHSEAVPFLKRARELDPNFARADVSLSMTYSNQGQMELAAEHAAKAYELRERVTEREKFDITSNYHALTTGDLARAIETCELWQQTYPRDYGPRARLTSLYRLVGEYEKAIAAADGARKLEPRAYVPYVGLGTALMQLNRFEDAQKLIEQGLSQQIGTSTSHRNLYYLAFLKNDPAMMKRELDWAANSSDSYWAMHWQALSAAVGGRLQQAQDFYRKAAQQAEPLHPARAAWFECESVLTAALFGQCQKVPVDQKKMLEFSRISLQHYVPVPVSTVLRLVQCGQLNEAQTLVEEVARRNPQATLANNVWLPVMRAAIELQRGNAAKALDLLQPVGSSDRAGLFWPNYLRGLAHLKLKNSAAAMTEFQAILDHRGQESLSPLYLLAHLQAARVAAFNQDQARSRQHYQEFLKLWNEADASLPLLIEARKEADRLN